MRVAVFVKATPSSEAGTMPSEFTTAMLADMGRFNEALVQAGIMKDGAGLHPSARGVRVRFSGAERIVIDGPFAETKELVAGYWLWEVESMAEAVEWVKRCPNPMPEDSEIEIRPLHGPEDLAELMTPELQQQEARLAERVAMGRATVQPYLFYGGRCEEALEFYRLALDATVGAMTLMASDGCGPGDRQQPEAGCRLALAVPTEDLADRVFEALTSDGGRVDMPLGKTFFSPRYGMATDPFGVGWMVMVPGQERG